MDMQLYSMLRLLLVYSTCATLTGLRVPDLENSLESDTYMYKYCSPTCGKYSHDYILRRFPGILFTEEEFLARQEKFKVVREDYLKRQDVASSGLRGDGDACCPTEIRMFKNTTMQNVYGETQYIVHMHPDLYQFIPHGFCVGKGLCDGVCAIEPVTHSLLTFSLVTWTFNFDQFIVPGYCSCKAS